MILQFFYNPLKNYILCRTRINNTRNKVLVIKPFYHKLKILTQKK